MSLKLLLCSVGAWAAGHRVRLPSVPQGYRESAWDERADTGIYLKDMARVWLWEGKAEAQRTGCNLRQDFQSQSGGTFRVWALKALT